QVATISVVPGMTHADIATDSPIPWWDVMNRRILKRLEGLHAEERELVLTEEEKQNILNVFFLGGGGGTFYARWNDSISHYTLKSVFETPQTGEITFRQDPLGVGAKNRVRLGGKAYLPVTYYLWERDISMWATTVDSFRRLEVPMDFDFIKRSGVWHLVRER
ncbi:MAG: hypothetical protein Q8P56_05260, partial [Candidatus Uhrbacteria bacterium]|nr:hypothetical protein [Candidatus Uhrbacteria bacterium]